MLYPAVIPVDGVDGMTAAVIAWLNNPASNARIRLYTNVYTPVPASVPGSFVEASFGGYAPMPLGAPVELPILPGGRVIWQWPMVTWTATGGGLPVMVHGMYVTFLDPLTSAVRVGWAQRFQSAQGLWAAGQTVRFTLSLGGREC